MVQPNRFPLLKNDCILCGRCMEVCPVFAATNKEELSPRAKGLLARSLAEHPQSYSLEKARELSALCAGCGRCSEVCPQGLDLPALLAAVKAKSPGWREWLWKTSFAAAPFARPMLSWALGHSAAGQGLFEPLHPWLRIGAGKTRSPYAQVLFFPGCMALYGMRAWMEKAQGC